MAQLDSRAMGEGPCRTARHGESRDDVGVRLGATVVGALFIVVGGIWFLQGIGVLGESGSGMTDDSTWALIGPVVAGAGIGLVAWSRHRSS
jgi:hypothetical protein